MSHTCTVYIQTHTFVYYNNIIDQTNAADAHVVFWSSVDQPPRTRCTYAHTNTRARSAAHAHREPCDNFFKLFRTVFIIIIISSRVQ